MCQSGNCCAEMSLQSWDSRVISQEVFLTGSVGYHTGGPSWAADKDGNGKLWTSSFVLRQTYAVGLTQVQRKQSWTEVAGGNPKQGVLDNRRAAGLTALFRIGFRKISQIEISSQNLI